VIRRYIFGYKFLYNKCLFPLALFILMMPGLIAQTSGIKLTDSKSSQPVSYATVLFVDLKTKAEYFKVTNERGFADNPS